MRALLIDKYISISLSILASSSPFRIYKDFKTNKLSHIVMGRHIVTAFSEDHGSLTVKIIKCTYPLT